MLRASARGGCESVCCVLLPPRAAPAYCARGFSRLRKSFLEIITLKIVQQVSRFLTFFFFLMPAELCIRDGMPRAARRLIPGVCHRGQADPGDTKLTGMGLRVRSPNHPRLRLAPSFGVFLSDWVLAAKKGARLLGIMHLTVIKMFPWSFTAKQELLPFI